MLPAPRSPDGRTIREDHPILADRGGAKSIMPDQCHLAITPIVLGRGEAMFAGIDLPALGYRVAEHAATEAATHIVLTK